LYERTTHGIALTAAGEALLPYACAVAQSLEQARHFVKHKGGRLITVLSIGLSHSLVPNLTPLLLKKASTLKTMFPRIRLHLSEGYGEDLMGKVLHRQLDAAFILEPYTVPPPTLLRERVGEDMFGLITPPHHPLSQQAMLPLSSLGGLSLILPSEQSAIHQRMQAQLAQSQVKVNILEVSGPEAVKVAVKAGLGLGISLQSYIASDLQSRQLGFIQFEENGFVLGYYRITQDLSTMDTLKRETLTSLLVP
jgi:DNA-binding transcriptional LysR family regulator